MAKYSIRMDGTSAKSVTHLVPVTCWYLVLAITPALTNDENKWVTPRLRLPVPGCHCKGLDNLGLRNKHLKKRQLLLQILIEALNFRSCVHRSKVFCVIIVHTLQMHIIMCTQCKAQEYNKLEVHHFLTYLFFRLHINSHRVELVRIQTRLLQKL